MTGAGPAPARHRRTRRWIGALVAVALLGSAATWVLLHDGRSGSAGSASYDADGDGRTDPVSWNPTDGRWRIGGLRFVLGPIGAIAVPADWDGDGLVDAATWDPTTGTWILPGRPEVTFGSPGDVPVPCDWDGDGTIDPAVWRPSDGAWYRGLQVVVHRGGATDLAVPGPWLDADRCNEAVFRPRDGSWMGTGEQGPFGLRGDLPVPADWDGDGTLDRAVWRPSTGAWIVDTTARDRTVAYIGRPGDLPVPADWDGDGAIDPAVWRPSTGEWFLPAGVRAAPTPRGDVALVAPPMVRRAALAPDPGPDDGRHAVAEPLSSRHWVLAVALVALAAAAWTTGPLRRSRRRRRAEPGGSTPGRDPAAEATTAGGHAAPRALEVLLYATALTMPMNALRLGPASIANALLAVLLIGVIGWRRREQVAGRWTASERRTIAVAAGLAAAGCLLGEVVAGSTTASLMSVARVLIGVIAPLAALTLVPWAVEVLTNAAVAFAAGAALATAAGPLRSAIDGRWMGLTSHPNHLGLVCLLAVAAAAAGAGATRWRRLAWALIAVNLVGLIESGSRSALLGLLVLVASGAWITWLARDPRPRAADDRAPIRRWAVYGGLIVLAGAVIWQGPGWARLGGDGASDSARWFRLQLAYERITRHPLTGEGLAFIEEAHSVPLQLAAAGGLLALVGGLLTLALPLLAARRVLGDHLTRWLCCGWLAYLAAATVQNIIVDRYLWTYAGVLIAAAHGASRAGSARTSAVHTGSAAAVEDGDPSVRRARVLPNGN